MKVILESNFPKLQLVKKGKVRDIYEASDNFVIVASDRLSAFDVIMRQGIPNKGKILSQISEFWFEFVKDIIPNHIISSNVNEYPEEFQEYYDDLAGRSMLVKKAKVIPIECIVRGYISGTGWQDYQKTGKISGQKLPLGLVESDKLPEPLFTPSTKAEIGDHDENISLETAEKIAGKTEINTIKEAALAIYKKAADYALSKGIIIADTKMEFGIYENKIIIVDEVLTPDSSRFWDAENYKPGRSQLSYDKQFIRDYLLSINFNKMPPPPDIPEEIIAKTAEKYSDVLYKLTGRSV